jgi:hypothetical protein
MLIAHHGLTMEAVATAFERSLTAAAYTSQIPLVDRFRPDYVISATPMIAWTSGDTASGSSATSGDIQTNRACASTQSSCWTFPMSNPQTTDDGRPTVGALESATYTPHDVQVLDPETMAIPAGAVRMLLNRRGLQAEGYAVGNRFHLHPCAQYSYADKAGLSEDNCQRRRDLEAMGLPDPVSCARLRVGLDCKSLAMAGKILSGAPIGSEAWQQQPDLHIGAPS